MGTFDMRDSTFTILKKGQYDLSPTAVSLLWWLLLNTFGDPHHRWAGFVNPYLTSNKELQEATRRSERAVTRGLAELESYGFIEIHENYSSAGRQPNRIKITVPPDWCWSHETRHPDAHCLVDDVDF